nr:type IV pilus modification protein PilV [Acinetobacter soli]
MINIQRGVGMVEVMVALLLLAIGVLGFTALQLRAVSASMEAGNQVAALNIARDLTERMRANPSGHYKNPTSAITKNTKCVADTDEQADDGDEAAVNDMCQIVKQADENGMAILLDTCPVSGSSRQCIYVAWDKTVKDFTSEKCYPKGASSYVVGSTCLFLEAY